MIFAAERDHRIDAGGFDVPAEVFGREALA
jgi:hypothetical protein